MTHQLTPEQELVVSHPLGQHARVLAVAGSGKSTTLAHRIKRLVIDLETDPGTIRVLMFNSLARKQFTTHLQKVGLPENSQPAVHTFHSFCFQLINQEIKTGVLPANLHYWLADKTELIWLTVKRAINSLERSKQFPADSVDPEQALMTINLWKGSLIPPEHAGSHHQPALALVYREFEQLRRSANALTFDDFIPTVVALLQVDPELRARYTQQIQFLIVDEYQDINYGQQRLIELLAGRQADVMVVGDDDQTIYEWRGARPNYILTDFRTIFNNKPVSDYRLSRSFRFGPLIAQCAANLIHCNTNRLEKPLIAHQIAKPGFITIFQGGYDPTKALADQVQSLLQVDKIPPAEVIVLARLFAQLDNLEAEFLAREIPYRVDGQAPFYSRHEITALLNYFRLAQVYDQPFTDESTGWFLNIANKPSRKLSQALLTRITANAKYRRYSPQKALEWAVSDPSLGLNVYQLDTLADFGGFLETLQERMRPKSAKAGELLDWLIRSLDYLAYFQNYYGQGEHADEKKHAVLNFIRYVLSLQLHPSALLTYLEKLDTTQGLPDAELVVFTTIFRTKGLEFDYVILPQCDDNLIPYLKGEAQDIFDLTGKIKGSELSSRLESERRLFYVALTRARKGVLVGAADAPSRFLGEIQLPDTGALMNILSHLAAGDVEARQKLLLLLNHNHIPAGIVKNLVAGYLPDLDQQELVAHIHPERR